MGKRFMIMCPECGSYNEAKTGFFAKKEISCACGNTINIKQNRMISKQCPHCENVVVYDQAKGSDAVCPICHHPINSEEDKIRNIEITCEQCGIGHVVSKDAKTFICPICNHENDVPSRILIEKTRKNGIPSVIKYEGDSETIVWKHPVEDFNYGSQLIVHESQEAVFFRDGQALDSFGPGRYTLETQNLPLIEKAYNLPTEPKGVFHSEVYYINQATLNSIKWGTDSKVRLFDPETRLHVEIGACGEFKICVSNSRKLLSKVVGTTKGLVKNDIVGVDGRSYFRALVNAQVKTYLAQAIRDNAYSIFEIDVYLLDIAEELRSRLNNQLDAYGLEIPEFIISRLITPDDDPDYIRAKKQFAEEYLRVRQEQINLREAKAAQGRKLVEADTDRQLKIIAAQGDAEAYRLKAEAEALEMQMKGYTYQQETAREVGLEAMKNGLGGGGSGTSALGEMASLGIGIGTIGSMAGVVKDAMSPVLDDFKTSKGDSPVVTGKPVWNCSCGAKNLTGKFCPECGAKKPEPVSLSTWDCSCGAKNLTGKFCPECGSRKPE